MDHRLPPPRFSSDLNFRFLPERAVTLNVGFCQSVGCLEARNAKISSMKQDDDLNRGTIFG